MDEKQSVLVEVSEDFHYDLDKSRRRTLPAGWRGPVEPSVAAALKKAGKGKKVAKTEEAAAKKAAEGSSGENIDGEKGDGPNTNPGGSDDPSDKPST
jgi:hypothetical protein